MEKISKIELFNGDIATVKDTENYKALKSEDYNFFFNKKDGYFVRWGKGNYSQLSNKITKQEMELFILWCNIWKEKFNIKEFVTDLKTDGSFENTSVEIVDWEISELCNMGCGFCYKSNVSYEGKNLSFEDFKKTFAKLVPSVTTIAFGIGSISLCTDLWKILNYTRENGIIPTITINGDATEEDLDKLANVVGACAVSVYDKEKSYNCIKGLTDRGLKQCNIHALICEETYNKTFEILNDIKTDSRLSNLRALVMLSLKEKGRSIGRYHQLSQDKFDNLFKFAIDNGIGCGFDSCSAAKAFNFIDKNPQYDYMRSYIEPCEAGGKYSSYLNVNCDYFPCSFAEGLGDWKTGLSVSNCNDFMKDIWFNEKTRSFGKKVKNCRSCNIGCPIYEI
jgi:hypothetical protein